MPTFDFIGYNHEERYELIKKITPILNNLDFANTIVFIYRGDQEIRVFSMSGEYRPLVRIYTRMKERAEVLLKVLKGYCDIEIVYLGYFQLKESNDLYP